jgi:hypothetical protein
MATPILEDPVGEDTWMTHGNLAEEDAALQAVSLLDTILTGLPNGKTSPFPFQFGKTFFSRHPKRLIPLIKRLKDYASALMGYAPSVKILIDKAKNGDDKSFLALVKIHTIVHLIRPGDDYDAPELLIPEVAVDYDFWQLQWVQKYLRQKLESRDDNFRKDFWDAIFSRQTGKLIKRTSNKEALFKKYVMIHKENWIRQRVKYDDIREELETVGLINEDDYADPETFRKRLNSLGVKKQAGRPKGSKNRI